MNETPSAQMEQLEHLLVPDYNPYCDQNMKPSALTDVPATARKSHMQEELEQLQKEVQIMLDVGAQLVSKISTQVDISTPNLQIRFSISCAMVPRTQEVFRPSKCGLQRTNTKGVSPLLICCPTWKQAEQWP